MEYYYEVIEQLNRTIIRLETMQQTVRKCDEWIDDSVENCIQNQEISDELNKINEKLQKAINEVEAVKRELRS